MPKDLHILLIEDDPFARDLMSMLISRDWRTRVVGELGSEDDVRNFMENAIQKIDAVLVDTEVPGDENWSFRIAELASSTKEKPCVVFTATKASADAIRKAVNGGFGGYLVKSEIGYSVAAAVARAAKRNQFILTPGAYAKALSERIRLPRQAIVLDGRKLTVQLTPRETEIARLAILFNQPHRDLSDELLIRADQVAKHVSSVYSKLGLDEFLAGEIEPEAFFEDQLILTRFRQILSRVAASPSRRKTADMATLAFHLLTVPEVREIF